MQPASSSTDLTLEKLYAALKNCYDPEMPVNIVDLGLIYQIDIQAGGVIRVKMTLTTPGCSMGTSIVQNVEEKLRQVEGVQNVQVEIVWEPSWSQHMISEEGRKKLGMG